MSLSNYRALLAVCVLLSALGGISCVSDAAKSPPRVLLYAGAGTSANDVAAVEDVLKNRRLAYVTTTTRQLNDMTESRLSAYQLMIVPGGNFITIADSLTPTTTAAIHDAVQGGLNYLGICAGAFMAGRGTFNSFDLTSGAKFGFYAAENRGIHKAAVVIQGVGATPVEHYWEDGPELTGWGAVVDKYPDGTPAVVEGSSGKGWVILTGIHPEAPDRWRRGMAFTTPASVANAYAGTLVDAALNRTALPHY